MKPNGIEIWEIPDRETVAAHPDAWCPWVTQSDIVLSMKRLANTKRACASRIRNYFPHRLTNGLMEGRNPISKEVKSKARGYRNSNYLKTIIPIIAGKLQPTPASTIGTGI